MVEQAKYRCLGHFLTYMCAYLVPYISGLCTIYRGESTTLEFDYTVETFKVQLAINGPLLAEFAYMFGQQESGLFSYSATALPL